MAKKVAKSDQDVEQANREAGRKLADMKLIKASGSGFDVFSDDGKFHISKVGDKTICSCPDWEGADSIGVLNYACEHIYAVRFFTEDDNKQDVEFGDEGQIVVNNDNIEYIEELVDKAAGELTVADSIAALNKLCEPLPKALIKSREVNWGKGFVEYIEWTSIPKILNKVVGAESWEFKVHKVEQCGPKDVMAVGSLTVLGITRENVGVATTAGGNFDMAIKGAVSDCLKRCAVLFGVAMELYEHDEVEAPPATERPASFRGSVQSSGSGPVGAATPKQLGMARAIAREVGVDLEDECFRLLNKETADLSKKDASDLIRHLQLLQRQPAPQTRW